MPESELHYVVRHYADDTLVFSGHSLDKASYSLAPGTCLGKGANLAIAEHACHVYCAAARESGKTLAHGERV